MISYDTGIVQQPPITPAMRQQALEGLVAQGASDYPSPFADVYNARAQQAAVDMERAAVRANNEHLANTQAAQAQLALQGGNLMQSGQQNANNFDIRRRGMAMDYASQMLGGVNNLLAGLYS